MVVSTTVVGFWCQTWTFFSHRTYNITCIETVKNIYCYWKREDTKYNDENMYALVFNTTGWDYGLR